jgi:hypothetical protein
MSNRSPKHTVDSRPSPRDFIARPALDAVTGRGLLTWWDLMSDLDPGWLAWSDRLDDGAAPGRQAA